MNKNLFALASGTFSLGIAEFVIMTILADVASGLDIYRNKAIESIDVFRSCFVKTLLR